jgi:drug/metabolite transporter (DMT)-like permease
MFSKVNWKRVAVSAAGVFGIAFVAAAAGLPNALGHGDWSTAKDAGVAGVYAGIAAIVEAVYHIVTSGFGDPTAK